MSDEPRNVTLSEVKKLLSDEAEERELSYEQSLALSHAEKFVELDVEETEELIEELTEEFDHVTERVAYKLGDILPQDVDGVKAVFHRDRYTPSDEDAEEIMDVIEKYL